jgi:hypothetical protein
MLRTVRRRAVRPVEHPRVIGIDDWAFRRGQRYGTLVCDLERRRVIALLPDRESGTVEAWLAVHPQPSWPPSGRSSTQPLGADSPSHLSLSAAVELDLSLFSRDAASASLRTA